MAKKLEDGVKPGNLYGCDMWECVFSPFATPGTYRLVVKGVGCSETFEVGTDLFKHAHVNSMQGFYYQRLGCEPHGYPSFPEPRVPLFRPPEVTYRISPKAM
jgi:hypothetical protein